MAVGRFGCRQDLAMPDPIRSNQTIFLASAYNSFRIGQSSMIALDGTPFWCVIFGLLTRRK